MASIPSSETGHDFSHEGRVPIAIVGYSLEFPQDATTPESFWQMIVDGRCASTEFPQDRLNIKAFYHPDRTRNTSIAVRGGSFVKEPLGAFDAPFFSITPAEAACMDPQHRRMLETAYHAFEDAGISLQACSGSNTSVYTGSFTDDYRSVMQQDFESEHKHAATGIAFSMLANRLSWFFNLRGASVNLDSACSSSLSALHFACQDIWTGSATMALVGGANYMYHPDFMRFLSNLNFLSPDGRCWSFDERANGYARGEGCAVLVLKSLPDAIQAGDNIRGIIRATGLNQDGRTPGITVPNEDAQVELITNTYRKAGLSMEPTRYFEAHGTGTAVGDPKEASAIGRSFGHVRSEDDPLYVGAVKANIGHLEGCSGLAGVIKTLLVLEKGYIPRIAGLETLNKTLQPEKWHLRFPQSGTQWPTEGLRRACVNSFGFGGTNATAILDDVQYHLDLYEKGRYTANSTPLSTRDASPMPPANGYHRNHDRDKGLSTSLAEAQLARLLLPRSTSTPKLLIWSASDEAGAKQLSTQYAGFLETHSETLDDISYILSKRRSQLLWRSFAISEQHDHEVRVSHFAAAPKKASEKCRTAFVFTGQGAQYQGMGHQLQKFQVFRDSLQNSQNILKQLGCYWSIFEFLAMDAHNLSIDQPEFAQPLTTCLQIALVDLFRSFGILPSLVMGHSSGEIAAAYAAGALTHWAAIKIAYQRGQVSALVARTRQDLGMLAVGLSYTEVASYLTRLRKPYPTVEVVVACINSPRSVTLSGVVEQLDILEQWLKHDSIFARKLRAPMAYHSNFMETVSEEYAFAMGTLEASPSRERVPMISSVTGDIVLEKTLQDPLYWVRNMISPVQFDAAFTRLLAQRHRKLRRQLGRKSQESFQITHILEVGPHSALQGPIRDIINANASSSKQPAYYASLSRGEDADLAIVKMAGALFCSGVPVDVAKVNQLTQRPAHRTTRLPQYPFNHSRIYWEESRLSKSVRFPKYPKVDILGTQIPDDNPHMPTWHSVIRLSELPWIQDHRVQGECILPASGSLVMAIEAFKQVCDDGTSLRGCQLRDVAFVHPIGFPSGSDRVETRLSLTLPPPHADRCSAWSEFRIFVVDEHEEFVQCCTGFIRGTTTGRAGSQSYPMPCFGGEQSMSDWIKSTDEACTNHVNVQDIYDAATSGEVQYGPCFQVLDKLRIGLPKQAVSDVKTGQWRTANSSLGTLHPIHPTVLDATMQLLTLALSQGRQDYPTMMPSKIASAWVDCQHTDILNEGRICSMARSRTKGYRRAEADIVATEKNSLEPLIWLQGMEAIFIEGFDNAAVGARKTDPNLCTRLTWKPDISTLSNEQLHVECTRQRPDGPPNQVELYRLMTLAASTFVYEAINFMDTRGATLSLPSHLKSYVEWMKYQKQRVQDSLMPFAEQEVLDLLDSTSDRQQLIHQVEHADSEGKLMMVMGRNLIPILSGEVDPLNLLFGDGLAEEFYEVMLSNPYHSHPSRAFLSLLSFKNPSLKILEVGAGTGGQTSACLEAMSEGNVKKFVQYDYTDISAGFFTQARAKFADYEHLMNFKTFNVERDPVQQGFEAGTYDLVVASHVIHATATLDGSLGYIRKLLKPGGKFLLFETTRPEYLLVGFVFGLLHGWWAPLDNEPRAEFSPCVSTAAWSERLIRSGFSGVDVEFLGQEEPECQYSSIIVATAVETALPDVPDEQIAIVLDTDVGAQRALAERLQQRLTSSKLYSLEELARDQTPPAGTTISLLEVQATLLYQMNESQYSSMHSILTRLRNTLWVTQSESGVTEPRHFVADGMARSLMSEDSTRKFASLALQPQLDDLEATVAQILESLAVQSAQVEEIENNVVVKQGMKHIVRVSTNPEINDMIAQKASQQEVQDVKVGNGVPLALQIATPGALRSVRYCQDETVATALGDDEITIKVLAFGLSTRDYLSAAGRLNELSLGSECAGIVQAVGSASPWKIGDRVAAIGTQTARTLVTARSNAVVALPNDLSFTNAASMYSAVWAAYHGLFDIGRIDDDDTILIHDATSNVGQILYQVARKVSSTVLSTAKSEIEAGTLENTFGVPPTSIIICADNALPGEVHRITHGEGVDVFIGPLSADSMSDYAQCVAPFGRLVNIKSTDSGAQVPNLTAEATKNLTMASVDMVEYLKCNPSSAYKIFQKAAKVASSYKIQPPQPVQVFQAGEIEQAFHHFEEKGGIGHVVVELKPDDQVQAYVPNRPKYSFSAEGTYVIAGGLGGLGRSFARWMVSRGARYLVLLSRGGVKTQPAEELVAELEGKGVVVQTPACDVTNISALKQTTAEIAKTMPPILGCIQATVALHDATFENMTFKDWQAGLDSKALGSWNLHEALPQTLDFFVIIASLNGIFGGRGQANYAAGNTFKDALAHYRVDQGLKAVSIDLGLVVDQGIVSGNQGMLDSLRRVGHLKDIQSEDLIALLDYYCDPNLPLLSHEDVQVLVGAELPSAITAKGADIHHSIRRPISRHLFRMGAHSEGKAQGAGTTIDRAVAMREAPSAEEAERLATEWFAAKVAHVLGLPAAEVDTSKPVHTYGVDSLLAIDLKNWFEKEVGADVPVVQLLGNATMAELGALAAGKSKFRNGGGGGKEETA